MALHRDLRIGQHDMGFIECYRSEINYGFPYLLPYTSGLISLLYQCPT